MGAASIIWTPPVGRPSQLAHGSSSRQSTKAGGAIPKSANCAKGPPRRHEPGMLMCGRFTLMGSWQEVAAYMALVDVEPFAPRANIAPTQPILMVVAGRGEG